MKIKDRTHSPEIFSFLILSALFVLTSAPPPSPPPPGGCAAVLVSFSQCLPYVSSLPDNISATASSQCCGVFTSTFDSGDGGCLCYLLRQPHLLGFPLNETRILSLSSVCPSKNESTVTSSSLEFLCSVSPTLPPLRSATAGLGLPDASASGSDKAPSSLMSLLPKSAESSPTSPSSSEPATDSSATKQINNSSISSRSSSSSWFLPGIMTSLALTFIIFQ